MPQALFFVGLLLLSAIASGQSPHWQQAGPTVADQGFLIELPIERAASKIYVDIPLGGVMRRFVVDTGSPSMISASLASELGLEPVGKSKGVDAHGGIVESNIVQADIALGGVEFQNVPMFVADYSSSKAAQCLLGDGVLGSEILPLCTWQFDFPDSKLRCASNPKKLEHIRKRSKQRLYTYGYPHTPYLDIQLARRAKSKTMFDTGSAPLFVISPDDLKGTQKEGGILRSYSGVGSSGTSLAGQSPVRQQQRVEIEKLAIGKLKLGQVVAIERDLAPSLIGASMLEQFVVTLDAKAGAIYFDRYRQSTKKRSGFGFALSFEGGTHVSLVWDDSPAAKAGLKVGQKIVSLNGTAADLSCRSIHDMLEHLKGDKLEVERAEGKVELKLPT